MENSLHKSVMLAEVIENLKPRDGQCFFDATFGAGGYSKAILESCNCKVIACDRDDCVLPIVNILKQQYGNRLLFSQEKFSNIAEICQNFGIQKLNGIVADIGVSSMQLDDDDRGFSFKRSGPIDMCMGKNTFNALDLIKQTTEKELADIIWKYSEEKFSRKIASRIKEHQNSLFTTEDLAKVIHSCFKFNGKIDNATRTFQALRIAVNDELGQLNELLEKSIELMTSDSKLLIVTFHSLEDRIVKHFFKNLVQTKPQKFHWLIKKYISPSDQEVYINKRSRSAKLRGIYML